VVKENSSNLSKKKKKENSSNPASKLYPTHLVYPTHGMHCGRVGLKFTSLPSIHVSNLNQWCSLIISISHFKSLCTQTLCDTQQQCYPPHSLLFTPLMSLPLPLPLPLFLLSLLPPFFLLLPFFLSHRLLLSNAVVSTRSASSATPI
jgi:hypothetical protein